MTYKEISQRMGKFEISVSLIEHRLDLVMEILAHVLILEATNHFYKNVIRYIGASPLFDEVPEGEEIPFYDAEIDDERVIFHRRP